MIGDDEIIFSGKYKELNYNVRYALKDKSEKEVAGALCEVIKTIEPFAYHFSEIDFRKVETIAAKAGNDLKSIARYIRENSIRKQLEGTVKEPKLVTASESYFFNRVLVEANILLIPDIPNTIKPETEKVEGQVVFVGKYGKWMAIKKLALEGVKDWEVSGILSGINQTAINKAFEFAGETEEVKFTKKRKSFSAAADLLEDLAGKLGDDRTKNAYMVVKSLEKLGYAPFAHPGMLTAAHPDIKPPKPRGRVAK